VAKPEDVKTEEILEDDADLTADNSADEDMSADTSAEESSDTSDDTSSAVSAPSGRSRGEGRRGRGRDRDRGDGDGGREKEFVEKLVKLNRTAKVVKGGRRFSFSALTVIGDRKGRVGFGFGKANDVSEAIRKSIDKAKRNMVHLPIKNGTIPHEITGFFKSSHVLLKPARSGTGIIAGGPVRAIMEAGGVTDVLSKSIGSSSQYNVVKATFNCISKMMDAKKIARNRGKSLVDLWG